MTSAELTKSLWDLANATTGFAAVQALVFAYACAKKEIGDVINRKAIKLALAVMLVLIGLAQPMPARGRESTDRQKKEFLE